MHARIAVVLLVAAVVSGCAPPVALHTSETDAPQRFESLLEQLTVGSTTRDDAHQLMGEPAGASNDGSVEIFRGAEGADKEVGFFIIVYPIPYIGSGEETICYVLLGYDRKDVLQNVDSKCATLPENVQLAVGEYRFETLSSTIITGESLYEEALIEPPGTHLPPPSAGLCRVLFVPWSGYEKSYEKTYKRRLKIDGQLQTTYGLLAQKRAIQMFLPAGEHRVKIRLDSYSWQESGKRKSTFNCPEGATVWLADELRDILVETAPDKIWWYGERRVQLFGGVEVVDDVTVAKFELPVVSAYYAR